MSLPKCPRDRCKSELHPAWTRCQRCGGDIGRTPALKPVVIQTKTVEPMPVRVPKRKTVYSGKPTQVR